MSFKQPSGHVSARDRADKVKTKKQRLGLITVKLLMNLNKQQIANMETKFEMS